MLNNDLWKFEFDINNIYLMGFTHFSLNELL